MRGEWRELTRLGSMLLGITVTLGLLLVLGGSAPMMEGERPSLLLLLGCLSGAGLGLLAMPAVRHYRGRPLSASRRGARELAQLACGLPGLLLGSGPLLLAGLLLAELGGLAGRAPGDLVSAARVIQPGEQEPVSPSSSSPDFPAIDPRGHALHPQGEEDSSPSRQ